jgi:hypothetical protein
MPRVTRPPADIWARRTRLSFAERFEQLALEAAISAPPSFLDQSAFVPWIVQTVGTLPTPADCVTCAPFMNQIATSPLPSCQRMSLVASPLKSPVSTIDQRG